MRMRFRLLGGLLLAVGLAITPIAARALTLGVGGPGLDQGTLCPTGSDSCFNESLASFVLSGSPAVTGTITYNSGPSTVDINVSTAGLVQFVGAGSGATNVYLDVLTTFAATGIPVISIPIGGGAVQLVQTGPVNGSVTGAHFDNGGGSGPVATALAAVSGLSCQIGTGADQCGFTFGPGGFTFGVGAGATAYDALTTFNVNVPEPASLTLLGLGAAGLALLGRRRA